MIWALVYLPVAYYLWRVYTSRIEPLSLSLMTAVVVGFCLVEWSMLKRDGKRSRAMMAVLCLTLGSLLGGFFFRP